MEITSVEWGVVGGGIIFVGLIYYYFFGPKGDGETAEIKDRVQIAMVTVDAAYIPEIIKLRINVPTEITFDRQDKGDCTEWVIFDKFPTKENKKIKARLPEGKRTTVRFTPTKEGEYEFQCGMGMVHGKLIIGA